MGINIYQHITDTFIESLEGGVAPWHQTWKTGMPRSIRQEYRGVNQFLLLIISQQRGYESNLWLTWNDIQNMGGRVRKGSKSAIVIYFKVLEIDNGGEDPDKVPMLRHYRVFNADVVDGLPVTSLPTPTTEHKEAREILEGYEDRPSVIHRVTASPVYRPHLDVLEMPRADQFINGPAYWQALFHELVHSTGHRMRLDRWGGEGYSHAFGSPDYSREELVAELCSAFLMHRAGLESQDVHDNSAAYLMSWIGVLKGDNKLVYQAASKAQKAADYILG